MSITSAKTGATGISLALENNFMEPIASVLVGSGGTASIEFSDIPQTYKHLQIRMIARMSFAGDINTAIFRYNFDVNASNSTYHEIVGSGSAVTPYGAGAPETNQMAPVLGSTVTANVFGVAITDLLDYSNTNKFKTQRNFGGYDNNGSGRVQFNSGLWMDTNPISSITIVPNRAGSIFVQHTRFSLYGIKG
jgi:hypothetical protein